MVGSARLLQQREAEDLALRAAGAAHGRGGGRCLEWLQRVGRRRRDLTRGLLHDEGMGLCVASRRSACRSGREDTPRIEAGDGQRDKQCWDEVFQRSAFWRRSRAERTLYRPTFL